MPAVYHRLVILAFRNDPLSRVAVTWRYYALIVPETTPSPQHKLHWLAEQALNWSGLPVVHVRPTVFLEGFFLTLTPDSVRESDQIRLPFGEGKTSPVAADDVARVIAALLANPQPHIGKIYHLTSPQSENMQM
ncbi:MAG TPA: hypothetical protein VGO27_05980 [Candidatus Acidoferrum sp.]|nr:hypothetical protein [Candidatus Acidoferrum sp.]